jgi:hypothetical protein
MLGMSIGREMIFPYCIGRIGGGELFWTSGKSPSQERRLRRLSLSFQGLMTQKGCSSGLKELGLRSLF